MDLKDYYKHSIIEELLVVLAGPASHFFILIILLLFKNFTNNNYLLLMNKYLFFFNLVPVYPLDGNRIISLILQSFLDIKESLYLQLKISVLSLCVLIIFYYQESILVLIIYLLYQQYLLYKEIPFLLIKYYLKEENKNSRIYIHKSWKYYRSFQNYYFINGYLWTKRDITDKLIENSLKKQKKKR